MTSKVEHLYIHIPFCKCICRYCDFVRFVSNEISIEKYIDKLIKQFESKHKHDKFKTIYIGGGTPNYLSSVLLNKLLRTLRTHLCSEYEFTIECNPEFLTIEQCNVLKDNGVNRASIGVQTTNDTILRKFNRQHTLKDVKTAIANLRKVGIPNISIDLIYGFNEMNDKDILSAIRFIKSNNIPHVSWYCLEVKPNSILGKTGYKLNDLLVDHHLQLIIKHMRAIKYKRYEVSNWSKESQYESKHNKAYWLTKPWSAIGLGACGYENNNYYEMRGTINEYKRNSKRNDKKAHYFQILMMGLRLSKGLDLSIQEYRDAYEFYKDKLNGVRVINQHLVANNLNLLDNILLELI